MLHFYVCPWNSVENGIYFTSLLLLLNCYYFGWCWSIENSVDVPSKCGPTSQNTIYFVFIIFYVLLCNIILQYKCWKYIVGIITSVLQGEADSRGGLIAVIKVSVTQQLSNLYQQPSGYNLHNKQIINDTFSPTLNFLKEDYIFCKIFSIKLFIYTKVDYILFIVSR